MTAKDDGTKNKSAWFQNSALSCDYATVSIMHTVVVGEL